jgi:hypothetical protein
MVQEQKTNARCVSSEFPPKCAHVANAQGSSDQAAPGWGVTPNHVLAATFGVPDSVFEQIPKLHKEVIVTSKRKRGR